MIVESVCERETGFNNETWFFSPTETELEEISGGEDFSEYIVPDGTELYMLEKEYVFGEHFNWVLRKYDWSAEKWKRMDGASAVCDDLGFLDVVNAYRETWRSLEDRGLLYH